MARRDSIEALIDDLGKIPLELRRELRPALASAAEPILRDAKARAGWSSRIPGAITIKSSFSESRPGVRLVVSQARAPHARPFEGLSRSGSSFRHPVFGNREVWVAQRTRPFFFPAVRAGREQVAAAAADALAAAARTAGFR